MKGRREGRKGMRGRKDKEGNKAERKGGKERGMKRGKSYG